MKDICRNRLGVVLLTGRRRPFGMVRSFVYKQKESSREVPRLCRGAVYPAVRWVLDGAGFFTRGKKKIIVCCFACKIWKSSSYPGKSVIVSVSKRLSFVCVCCWFHGRCYCVVINNVLCVSDRSISICLFSVDGSSMHFIPEPSLIIRLGPETDLLGILCRSFEASRSDDGAGNRLTRQ